MSGKKNKRLTFVHGSSSKKQDDIKKAEEVRRKIEAQFLNIAKSISLQISISRASDGTILYTNSAYDAAFGYAEGELIGRKALDLYYDSADRANLLNTLKKQGFIKDYEVKVKRQDGASFWVSASIQPINFAGELAYLGTSMDITERKQATDMLRKARDELEAHVIERTKELKKVNTALDAERKRFNDVLETLPAYLILLTPDYQVPFANKFFRERFGESCGRRCYEYLFKRNEPCEVCKTYDTLKTNAPLEWEWLGPDGHNYYIYDFPFTDSDGSPLIMEMGIDITRQKQAEEELRKSYDELELRVQDRTKELKTSEEKFKNLYTAMNEGVCLHEILCDNTGKPVDYKILDVNPMFEKITGFTKNNVTGKLASKVYQTVKPPYLDIYAQVALTGKPDSFETYFPPMKKHFNISVFSPEKGKFATVFSDITERKKSEEALLQAKMEWERTFNSVPDLIAILDTKHRIIRANKAMAKRLGVPIDQCVNLKCHLCVHGKNKPPELCPHKMTLKDSKEHTVELHEEKLGGYFLVSTTPLFDAYGTLQGSVHVARDITDRKRIEDALKESEIRLNRAQEIAHLGSWELDVEHNHLTWSDEAYRIFGLQPQEFDATYEAFLEAVHPEDRTAVDIAYSDSLHEGRNTYEIEHRIVKKDGEVRFVHEKCEHIRDESGQIMRSLGMVQDITEQRLLDEKMRHLASFPQLNPSPVLEINQSGEILYQNPATQNLFPGLTNLSDNHPFLSGWTQVVKELKKNKWSKNIIREIAINQSYYQQIITPYEKNKIRLYAVDITQLKKAEEALRKSEEKYRDIVENTTNLIMVTQPNGIISYLSPSSFQVIGYSPQDLVGSNPIIFHPDDVKKVQQIFSRALNGEKGSGFEYRVLTKQGDVKWVSHAWSPIFVDKKLQSIVSIVEDITQRKEIQKSIQKLNQNLMHQANELTAINKELETFSYSVSHDLRAPLRSIDGFSEALLEDYADRFDDQGREYIRRIRNATQRMGQLIDDMLRLSRLTRVEMTFQKVDLGQTAARIIKGLQKAEPTRKIKFITHDNLIAEGDSNLLHILLENLLENAWKFTNKRKRADIEFGKTQQEKETVFFIRDNGAGFDMKYADKLFIPFHRLHDDADYPGTGIGLGIVSRIIHRHGGRIWAEAEEEKGATFYFTLGGKSNE